MPRLSQEDWLYILAMLVEKRHNLQRAQSETPAYSVEDSLDRVERLINRVIIARDENTDPGSARSLKCDPYLGSAGVR